MNTKTLRIAALAAKASRAPERAALRSAGAFNAAGVQVDDERSVIQNAAVMVIGPAEGHGWEVDATTLSQVAALINAKPNGVPIRFKHPGPPKEGEPMPETLGTDVGYLRNARVVGDAVRGDVHLMDYAEVLPGLGNAKEYLLRKAKGDPAGIGLSPVVWVDFEEKGDAAGGVGVTLLGRVSEVYAVDFVGKGATTPNGLLSAGAPTSGAIAMNSTLKQLLCAMGLSYDASDEAAQAYFDALSDAQKQDIQGRLDAAAAAAQVEAEQAAIEAGATQQMAAKVASATVARLTKTVNRKGVRNMNEKIKQCLSAHFGLAADATDEDAQKLYDENKSAVDAKVAALSARPPGNADPATVAALAVQTQKAQLIAEGERVSMLRQLGDTLGVDKEIVQLAIAKSDDVTAARTRYLDHLATKCKPVEHLAGSVQVGENKQVAALSAALPDAIMLRAGQRIEKPHELATKLRHLTVLDMYREYLEALGAPVQQVRYLSRPALVDLLGARRMARAFPQVAMLAQSTGSFDNILLDAANKTARAEYQLAPATWTVWARRSTAPDFKNINRVQLSDNPGLVARKEGGEIKYAALTDSKESYTLAEYVNGLILTRRAMVNDDLDVFSRIPRAQMQSAKQLEDDVCYAVLTGNATMGDGNALFSAAHANLDSATGFVGAPSVTTLGYGRKALRTQTGPKGNHLNLLPKYLIVPAALETVADQYTSANYVAAVQTSINPFAGNGRTPITPVVESRLDASSTTKWYLGADNASIDTVEVCFLDGEPEPVLKQESDFDTDDLKFAVRHTVAAKAIDHRGLYCNNGS